MGETRVDLQHLLEDLRDAYQGSLEETILTEMAANALDSGATRINFATDPAGPALTVIDNGSGMRRRELARYHDISATAKIRGQGIGFAGVGIKLGLLAAGEVLTETSNGKALVASAWRLASRQRAPWRWIPPPGLVKGRGTAVRLMLRNPLSSLLDPGFIAACLERQYRPLLDPSFDKILGNHYPHGVVFYVNGEPLLRQAGDGERAALEVRLGRKRNPAAIGYLARSGEIVAEEERGVAVSTLGKVIRRGWDWLGLAPARMDNICGLFEAPALAACLTLSKGDFIRAGQKGAMFLAYRKAIQEAVSAQLALWGEIADGAPEPRRRTLPVEREVSEVLTALARDFPLLASLVLHRPGSHGQLTIGGKGVEGLSGRVPETAAALPAPAQTAEPEPPAEPAQDLAGSDAPPPLEISLPEPKGRRRHKGRYALDLRFEQRPEDSALGRLVESTVWVNEAHPAYRRAVASRSEGYHLALCVAMALAPLVAAPEQAQKFLAEFLSLWGRATERPGQRRGRGR